MFTMPYFSGNLLQRNWDAITAALNSGGGGSRQQVDFAVAGALPAIAADVTVYNQNGGVAITVTLADPAFGTDDAKEVFLTLQSGNGSTVQTTSADFTEDSTGPLGNACVHLIAVDGQWQLVTSQGVTIT